MNTKNTKTIIWLIGVAVVISLGFFMYQMTQSESVNSLMILLMLLLGLMLGGLIAFLALKKTVSPPPVITESSHTIAESMRKVFKIVSAEGHFNEIYNYEETSRIFNFIPSKKKALVIVQAKVLVGYDFEKFKWEIDEENRSVRLVHFPPPEILSTETDYKYYNIEEQFFNLFSKDDLAKVQQNGKRQVMEAARKSHLSQVAAEQMRTLLTELLAGKNFSIENTSVIRDQAKMLPQEPQDTGS